MIEPYIEYWGLEKHPFLLAPDSTMMCVAGQYYECLERLKYAVHTGKGGALIVSEDAGLGKTTTLFKLIDEMREEHGEVFRYAFVDHPTLNSSQMIAQITESISGVSASEDKLKNLNLLKDVLVDIKEHGGSSIIIVDEGQMLCTAHDVLQELRILINLTHNGEYLHTFILSGQRTLWGTVKSMPEFWQRLPVRYYFAPLQLEETKEIIRHRLKKAGLEETRDVFAEDALEIIHRYSMGSPRTVIALSDLSLLVGYTNRAHKITFKEVSKAINTMSGKGDSFPYVREGRKEESGLSLASYAQAERGGSAHERSAEYNISASSNPSKGPSIKGLERPLFYLLALLCFVFLGVMGYRYLSISSPAKKDGHSVSVKEEPGGDTVSSKISEEENRNMKTPEPGRQETPAPKVAASPETITPKPDSSVTLREAVITKDAANVRIRPDLEAPRIAVLFQGETLTIAEENTDTRGLKWYKVHLYGTREGWIASGVVSVK